MKYYVAELENVSSYRKATEIEAKNLLCAKIKASRNQAYFGTILEIGTEVNEDGYITHPIARKENDKWTNLD